MISPWAKYPLAAVTLLLIGQGVLVRGVNLSDVMPVPPALNSLPGELGAWKASQELLMDNDVYRLLRPDDYLGRRYENGGNSAAAPVNLLIAYFGSRYNDLGPHSPKVCLPAAGWKTEQSSQIDLPVGPGRTIPVNRVIMQRGRDRISVLYWYQNERFVYASEVWSKVYLLPDLLRHKRTDIALVRLDQPLPAGKDDVEVKEFAHVLFPQVERVLKTW